jgi:Uma2 family endonuclease
MLNQPDIFEGKGGGKEMDTLLELEKKPRYTYHDYAQLPEGAPYQLIGGELIMTPSPVPYHQDISRNLEFLLLTYIKSQNLGKVYDAPIDVYLEEEETYQPDIIFISRDRLSIVGEKKIEGAPDLVIEILSPATAYYDLRKKKEVYEKHGVKEYWIVDPIEKIIEVFENKEKGFELYNQARVEGKVSSRLLENFSVDLKDIF